MKKIKTKLFKYLDKLKEATGKPELRVIPGNVAFNIVLAFFPFVILIVLIASLFNINIDTINELIKELLPASSSSVVIDIISGKGFDKNVGIFATIGILIATNGVYSLITASNMLYDVEDYQPIKDRVKSFIILFIILVLFIFLLIVPMFGDKIINLLVGIPVANNFLDEILIIFKIIKWPIALIIVYFNIKLIYAIAPSTTIDSKKTSFGAMFTTVIWIVSSFIFKYYLNYFARYDIIYGNLSQVIILMIWLYLLSYVFVLGMAINIIKYGKK